ncbi:hypothetical protein Salat_2330400 [Sesamum alatum]|uniref:Uncharacterized protein n=1 Tax=Sesamum alatum TaxID=300844 RepID=A0AAE1XX04_9LAMI|nr:hypothetical protein Salat_2330400 [Sesamum alatum]
MVFIMAAEKCVICLIGAMDRLWFHHIVLFQEPSLCPLPEDPKTPKPTSESPQKSSKNSSPEQEISPVVSSPQDETSSQESETTHDDEERNTKFNLAPIKTRFLSSSPKSAQKQSRNLGYATYSEGRLRKTTSCKSLLELELEEVKGFMDLGFIFRKENLSKRMKRLIPGLQRLDADKNKQDYTSEFTRNTDDAEDEEEKGVMRPYLSEAWLIKRPDSPLLNLRIPPRVSTAADMKKHLKSWARTVASAIQQES